MGSADAPSVGWMRGDHPSVTLDLFPDGLVPGEGVCGSAEALPFADEAFDVVAAFDVVEHCEDDALAVSELARVLAPGGRMLLSVPAYQWAWSDHDVRAGPPPPLHAAAARAAGGGRGALGRPVDVRLRRGVPPLRRRARPPPAAGPGGPGVRRAGCRACRHARTRS